jgi:CheY-like chemotaxis protein
MLRMSLEDAGHRVTEAADGGRAVEIATAPDARFDVALIDIGLPVLSGLEVARRLRDLPPERAPRMLVALTGYGAPEDQARSRDAGFDLHLIKPVDAAALMAHLRSMRAV